MILGGGNPTGGAGREAGGDDLAPFGPGDQQEGHAGKCDRHQNPRIDRFAAQILERREQGEIPRGVTQGAGLREVADVLLVGFHFAIGGEGQFFLTFGQFFPGQGLQFVQREPVVLKAAGEFFLGFVAQWNH